MNAEKILNIRITDILSVVKTTIKASTKSENRNRKSSGFALKTAGRTTYFQNGKSIISDPHHIVFLPKGSDYTYFVEENGDCFIFELDIAGEQPFSEITSLAIKNHSEASASAEKAERFFTYKKPGYRNKCMSCIYNILSNVITDTTYVNSAKYELIKPSIRYLEKNLGNPDINTELLAEISEISIPYFRKLFFEIYKMPVAKYIESVRIGKARELLKNDFGSVGDVSELVGYRNIYHFSKAFKKVTGISPSEFARQK